MPTIHSKQHTRPALLFCALTYALTWLWWLARLLPHLRAGFPIDRANLGPLDVTVGMFVPLLVALGLRAFVTKEGLHGSFNLKQPWTTYALAYLLPTGLGLLAIALNHFSGLARFAWADFNLLAFLPGQLLITLLAAMTALGEEYGWRGYLLPKLMPLGPVRASLLVGLIWGGWHLPLVLSGLTYPGQPLLLAVPIFLLSTVLLSFLFTDFQQRAGNPAVGLPVIAALVHGSLNALSELSTPSYIPVGNPLFTNPFGLTTALVVFVAVLTFWTYRNRSMRSTLLGMSRES